MKAIEEKNKNKTVGAWVIMGLCILYGISPIDIIPDIPVVGWVDDFFITSIGVLNLIQAECKETNRWLGSIAKIAKWIMIGLGVIIILLIVLLGTLIVRLFTN